MKVLILAAGYGTRLERDLRQDLSGEYKHLIGVPKPLLPIGRQPLISYWLEALKPLPNVSKVYVVTNDSNYSQFKEWADSSSYHQVELLSDGSTCNEERPGAMGCIEIVIKHLNIKDNLLVIAGDTLFYEDFSLTGFITHLEECQQRTPAASLVSYVTCDDQTVKKRGILELDELGKVTGFLEKPDPTETPSRKSCPAFYLFSKDALLLVTQFLQEKKGEPLQSRDAPGNFVSYLHKRSPVYAKEVSGRFDVGGLQSYIECHKHFLQKGSSPPS